MSSHIDASVSRKEELKPPVVNQITSDDPWDKKINVAMGKIKKLQKQINNYKFQLESQDDQKVADLNNDLSLLKTKFDDLNSEN